MPDTTLTRSRPALRYRAELVLLLVTVIWGASFLVTQKALTSCGPLFFVFVRYATAALAMGLPSVPTLLDMTRQEFKAGFSVGVCIFLGLTLQGWGLLYIPSSSSAFISALYVPAVPVLLWILTRKAPLPRTWAGIGLAFIGLVVLADIRHMTLVGSDRMVLFGQILTLFSALAIAGEVVMIGKYAVSQPQDRRPLNIRRVCIVQVATAAFLCIIAGLVVHEPLPSAADLRMVLPGAMGLGVASAFIQLSMNWAQRTVSATRAALIYAAEPVWAGIFGHWAGEALPPSTLMGAVCIIGGVIVSELRIPSRKRAKTR